MSKHSKHAHTRPNFTNSEVAKAMAHYGTQKARLTADSQRPWDCCSITLVPVVDPVCTPQGYLFSYEAILQNLLEQKQRYKRDLKAFKRQQDADAKKAADTEQVKHMAALAKFVDGQDKLRSGDQQPLVKKSKTASETNYEISNIATERFAGVEAKVAEPKKGTVCPESGAKLKAKQLLHVKLWKLPVPQKPSDTSSGVYGCQVCQSVILNATTVCVYADTGAAVCSKCAEPTKEGAAGKYRNPFTGALTNVIVLKRGGTGFAGNRDQAVETKRGGGGFTFG